MTFEEFKTEVRRYYEAAEEGEESYLEWWEENLEWEEYIPQFD